MAILSPKVWRGSSRIACKGKVTDSGGEVLIWLVPASTERVKFFVTGKNPPKALSCAH